MASVAADGWHVGELGDWAIVSFPKVFPVRAGGLLAGPAVACEAGLCDAAAWWPSRAAQMERRRAVFAALSERARPLYELTPGVVPWFFPVAASDPARLMAAARARGVECGLWHGAGAVVLPCHQCMGPHEIAAVAEAIGNGI